MSQEVFTCIIKEFSDTFLGGNQNDGAKILTLALASQSKDHLFNICTKTNNKNESILQTLLQKAVSVLVQEQNETYYEAAKFFILRIEIDDATRIKLYNTIDSLGIPLLGYVAELGSKEEFDFWLSQFKLSYYKEQCLNYRNDESRTALSILTEVKFKTASQLFVDAGADKNFPEPKSESSYLEEPDSGGLEQDEYDRQDSFETTKFCDAEEDCGLDITFGTHDQEDGKFSPLDGTKHQKHDPIFLPRGYPTLAGIKHLPDDDGDFYQ